MNRTEVILPLRAQCRSRDRSSRQSDATRGSTRITSRFSSQVFVFERRRVSLTVAAGLKIGRECTVQFVLLQSVRPVSGSLISPVRRAAIQKEVSELFERIFGGRRLPISPVLTLLLRV
jgi:hypothetical protein